MQIELGNRPMLNVFNSVSVISSWKTAGFLFESSVV